jgi:hypothetical protein
MTKKKGTLAVIAGGIFAGLGTLGGVLGASAVCIPCTIPALGYLLAFLGILGISFDLLTGQTVLFSLIGITLLGGGIYYIRKPKVCSVPEKTKHKVKKKTKK